MLHEASLEQQEIINNLRNNKNVMVNAVPGSGKTTTALHVAKAFPNEQILLLTYNKSLRETTEERRRALGLKKLIVETIHSFAGSLFGVICKDDQILENYLEIADFIKPINFGIVIIDEAQDLTPLFYKFLIKLLNNNLNKNQKILIMGDVNQTIYDFNLADHRYLAMAPKIFNMNNKWPWVECKLSTSYRLPNEIAGYMNDVFLKQELIVPTKEISKSFEYLKVDVFDIGLGSSLYKHLKSLIQKYGVENSLILCNSTKVRSENNPLNIFLNALGEDGFPIGILEKDTEKKDWGTYKNKLVCATFHAMKGLERDLVIVFNYDNYLLHNWRKSSESDIHRPLFVACTRAKSKLVVLHHYQEFALPFLDQELNKNYIDDSMLSDQQKNYEEESSWSPNYCYNPSTITDYMPASKIIFLMSYIKRKTIKHKENSPLANPDIFLSFKSKINSQNCIENVSMITGESFISNFERFLTKQNKKLDFLLKNLYDPDKKLWKFSSDLNDYKIMDLDYEDINRIATIYYCFDKGYWFKAEQISRYDWINEEDYLVINNFLSQYINKKTTFEWEVKTDVHIPQTFDEKNFKIPNMDQVCEQGVTFYGRIDAIDYFTKTVWEFKFVNELKDEYFLQLYIYASIWYLSANTEEKMKIKEYKFKLMNVKWGEIYELDIEWDKTKEFLYWLTYFKTRANLAISDNEFLTNNLALINDLISN